jgi:hypothetical protein
MQELPRKQTFFTPARNDWWITLLWIIRLSYRNSPGDCMFAMIPPTRAAARNTYSGFSSEKNSFTVGVSRRSSSFFARVTMFP